MQVISQRGAVASNLENRGKSFTDTCVFTLLFLPQDAADTPPATNPTDFMDSSNLFLPIICSTVTVLISSFHRI